MAKKPVLDRIDQALLYALSSDARASGAALATAVGVAESTVSTRLRNLRASGLIRGALEAAEAANHVMLVLETGGEPAREVQAIEAALDRQVDGIIFAAMRAREVFVPDLPASTSVIMLNGTSSRFKASVARSASSASSSTSASHRWPPSPTATVARSRPR